MMALLLVGSRTLAWHDRWWGPRASIEIPACLGGVLSLVWAAPQPRDRRRSATSPGAA